MTRIKYALLLGNFKTWHFLLISAIVSEFFTLVFNSLQSFLRWGSVSSDVIEIGIVDALLVSLIVTLLLVPLLRYSSRTAIERKLLAEDIVEHKRVEDALRNRTQQLEALRLVSVEITHELDLTRLLGLIHRRAADLLGATPGFLSLYDEITRTLIPRCWEDSSDWMGTFRFHLGEGISGTVAEQRRGMIVNDYRNSRYALPYILDHSTTTAIVAEPLIYRDRLVGVVTVDNQGIEKGSFTEEDREVLTFFAAQAAIAIENARLFEAASHELAERIQAEAALQQSEQRFRTLAEAAFEGISFTENGVYLDVNDQLAKMVGYDRGDLVGQPIEMVIVPEAHELARQAQRERKVEPYEHLLLRKDGSTFPAEIRARYASIAGREVRVAAIRDITDRKQAEEALRQANLVVESSPVVLFRWKAADGWPVEYVSENVIQFGYSPYELLTGGTTFTALVHPDDRNRVFQEVQKYSSNGSERFEQEYRILTKDGSVRWADVRTRIEHDAEGLVAHYQGIVIDITEQRKVEDALRRTQFAVDRSGEAIFIIESNAGLTYVNDAACRSLGYTKEELLSMKIFDFDPSFSKERWTQIWCNNSNVESYSFETSHKTKDGRVFPVEVTANPINFAGEEYRVSHVRDITKRKEYESQLEGSKKRLQTLFDGISEPMLMTAIDGCILIANRAAIGYCDHGTFLDVIGMNINEFLSAHYGVSDKITRALGSSSQSSFVLKRMQSQGSIDRFFIYPVIVSGKDTGEDIIRIVDITKEKVLEQQMVQTEKLSALGLLVAGIAHEINNPNNFIIFNMPILRTYLDAIMPIVDDYASTRNDFSLFNMTYADFRTDIHNIIDDVEQGAQRISAIVHDLRDFSHKGDIEERTETSPADLVKRVIAMCQSSIAKVRVKIAIEEEKVLPKLDLPTGVLEQVLVNLILNSVQAADKDNAYVTITIKHGLTWTDYLTFIVKDNGKGMDDGTRLRIFDPFFSTKPRGEGTGLGLYISKMLVNKLGGDIICDSTPGEGSVFTVTIPREVIRIDGAEGL